MSKQRIQKSRLMELSGFNKGREPLLITESGPVYAYDLAEMIQQEIRNVLNEMKLKNFQSDIITAQNTKSVSAAMGFVGPGFSSYNNIAGNRIFKGAGGTRSMLGPGFR